MDIKNFLNRHALKSAILGFVFAFVLMGIGAMNYTYADSPAFCGSCHSMTETHESWAISNHKQIACTECHLPHWSFAGKMVAKAQTGMNDTYHEVLRDYPAHIKISAQGKSYVNDNCMRCHQSTMEKVHINIAEEQDCLKCHSSVAHGSNHPEGGIKVE